MDSNHRTPVILLARMGEHPSSEHRARRAGGRS